MVKIPRAEYISFAMSAIGNTVLVWAFLGPPPPPPPPSKDARASRGEDIEPERWRQLLRARDDKTVLLDVRNSYEWDVGHFRGSQRPSFREFRNFDLAAFGLEEKSKDTPIMMCRRRGLAPSAALVLVFRGWAGTAQAGSGVRSTRRCSNGRGSKPS